jgi:histidine triad (HIT) family protein
MSSCIFCGIIAGEVPSRKVYEDSDFLAFLDIFPANPGHTLVIPKTHLQDIHEMSAIEYGELASRAKIVADLLVDKLNAEGMTIFQMNKEAGWQTVFHAHMHVIPRFKGDALHQPWVIRKASEEELDSIASKLG